MIPHTSSDSPSKKTLVRQQVSLGDEGFLLKSHHDKESSQVATSKAQVKTFVKDEIQWDSSGFWDLEMHTLTWQFNIHTLQ